MKSQTKPGKGKTVGKTEVKKQPSSVIATKSPPKAQKEQAEEPKPG